VAQLLAFVHAGGDLSVASRALSRAGLAPVSTWDSIGVAVGVGTPAELRKLAKAPGVTYVEGDQPLAYTMQTSHVATRGRQTRTYGPFLTATGASQIDGRGVSVAVIDSGIDGTHPMFDVSTAPGVQSKVRRNLKLACPLLVNPPAGCFADVATNDSDTISNGGHGTHVAGTVAGVDVVSRGRSFHGAAPGADLIGLSVGQAISVFGGNQAMQWVVDHQANPCAGTPRRASPPRVRRSG